jgi:hypothetical protein
VNGIKGIPAEPAHEFPPVQLPPAGLVTLLGDSRDDGVGG